MNIRTVFLLGSAIFLLMVGPVIADDDHDHGEHRKHLTHGGRADENLVYQDNCGACHFAYPPELMPWASWRGLMGGLDRHFGENVDLDPGAAREISTYLEANSADKGRSKLGRKILGSLRSQQHPTRITQIPYIQHKHHDVPPQVFDRVSVGSLANCAACHPAAGQGDFDDDRVRIPD